MPLNPTEPARYIRGLLIVPKGSGTYEVYAQDLMTLLGTVSSFPDLSQLDKWSEESVNRWRAAYIARQSESAYNFEGRLRPEGVGYGDHIPEDPAPKRQAPFLHSLAVDLDDL